ncbi:hypothetical protein P8C59_007556 [Phyllachora maydis]|uniref:Uncharacterized protein n=1 Tax=Phyllachora maydis TaxID=1825666 RepID=A0AAD9I9Z4_9PEZI|nr:hypothetical protein P8C59_007556 [Phyllachora maydis]
MEWSSAAQAASLTTPTVQGHALSRSQHQRLAMAPVGDQGDHPWSEETKGKFKSKSKSKFLDPCQEAADKSIRCLRRNDGDRSMCQDYFQAYRDCKKEWINKRKEERRFIL